MPTGATLMVHTAFGPNRGREPLARWVNGSPVVRVSSTKPRQHSAPLPYRCVN